MMKSWLIDARTNCPQEGQSVDEFFMEETKIIDENDTMLNVVDYFNVDHELE
jgi:hypothetical protein